MDDQNPFFDQLEKIKKEATEGVTGSPKTDSPNGEHSDRSELLSVLERIARDVQRAIGMLKAGEHAKSSGAPEVATREPHPDPASSGGVVIEGIFDGTGMMGSEGKHYSMPPNYASKSKLVEGDSLKLTISPEGSFIYKQIHPLERERVKGTLVHDAVSRQYSVAAEEKSWKVLTASVTYYKGVVGDEVVILVPKDVSSTWGAVEHIIKLGAPSN